MVDKDTLKIVNDALDAVKLMNRKWQSLSDDEIDEIVVKSDSLLAKDIARSIEQALKEKNT